MKDCVVSFSVPSLEVRGSFARLSDTLMQHNYRTPVLHHLGQATALAVSCTSLLKDINRFLLQAQSNGPITQLVVQVFPGEGSLLGFRNYARFLEKEGDFSLGVGHLAITLDPKEGEERYQGIVALTEAGLEAAACHYFEQSEQIPTCLRLASRFMPTAEGESTDKTQVASAFILQKIPQFGGKPILIASQEKSADLWREAQYLFSTLEEEELLDLTLDPLILLQRLFSMRGDIMVKQHPVIFQCTCSRERIFNLLKGFSREEQCDMIAGGQIEVSCEFCSKFYFFPAEEIL